MPDASDDRPSILLITTDQQRADCLGIEGHPVMQTPTMNALASSHGRFTNAYSTCPSCVPARRSLMSGQAPVNTGLVGYKDGVEWEAPPPLLPQVLRDHGYQTALIGRSMHLSPPRKRYGFEHQVYTGDPHNEYGDLLRQHNAPDEFDYHSTGPTHNDWMARPWPLEEHLHPTNYTVTEALKWLKHRDPTAPFFLTVQFLAPHAPLVPPAFYMDRYLRTGGPDPVIGDWAERPAHHGRGGSPSSNKVDLHGETLEATRAAYYGLINHIDDQLRRLLRPFMGVPKNTRDPAADNTWIIFTSDHGEMLGDHYWWNKRVPYQGSARVPMFVTGPRDAGLQPDQKIDELVCLEDIMPTCLDIANVDIPDSVDGRSLLPLLRGEQTEWRDHLHIEQAPQHQTITDGKEKFIFWVKDGVEQFFDLASDPDERHDRINDPAYADRVAHWRHRLIEKLKGRPEGLTDGEKLIPGVPYQAELDHARRSPWAASTGSAPHVHQPT